MDRNTETPETTHDDSLVADAETAFVELDASVEAPDPGAGPNLMLIIDELVEELVEAAEAKIMSDKLEIAITIEGEGADGEAQGDAGDEVAEVA